MTHHMARVLLVAAALLCAVFPAHAEEVETIRGRLEAEMGQPPAEGKPLVLMSVPAEGSQRQEDHAPRR